MDEAPAEMWQVFVRANDGPVGFYQTFWLDGEFFGEVAKRVYEILEESGATQATIVDYEWSEPTEDAIEIIPKSHLETVRTCWDLEPYEPYMLLPHGVVPYRYEHSYELDELAEAVEYTSSDEDGKWPHFIEASVGRPILWSRFLEALRVFTEEARLEIVVHGHWKDFGTTVYMRCPEEWTRADMLRFLDNNYAGIVLNGHIGIAFLHDNPDSVLQLTQHKTICCTADEADTANAVADTLLDLPLAADGTLRCLSRGYTHQHYAWPGTLERADFMRMLYRLGFTLRTQVDETYKDYEDTIDDSADVE